MAEHVERMGRRIRERRLELNLTQSEFARLLSGSPDAAQVSRWERGTHEPNPDRREDIAKALKTTVADLMAGAVSERDEKPAETPDMIAAMNGDASALADQIISEFKAALAPIEQRLDAIGSQLTQADEQELPEALAARLDEIEQWMKTQARESTGAGQARSDRPKRQRK